MAGSSDRRLVWSTNDTAQIGSGITWLTPVFPAAGWSSGNLPAGYGFTGLSTDLRTTMSNQAPSLYLRKQFAATADQAAGTNALILQIDYNDGFVAYLNGHEVARANCGATNHFMYACQPAYNVTTTSGTVQFSIGPASRWLVSGQNLLSIQAHNAEQPSTASNPGQILQHTPTPEFKINAGLSWISNSVSVDFIPLGSAGGAWCFFIGRYEPSGGVVDEGLITNNFNPPLGEEDDYDEPASFVDWVELYNNGASPVNLSGWSLTDDPDLPAKWLFPTNTTIAANAYLLVLCDDRNEANAPAGPAQRLHSNFKLGREGEYLGLFDASATFVDGFASNFPAQRFYCSYGRNPANPSSFGYFDTATPGTNNSGSFYPTQVAPPLFKNNANADLLGGIYTNASLTLQLVASTPGSTIRYTLNGSEPTAVNGSTYTIPLTLTQSSDKTGNVVRARAFLDGSLPSDIVTYSYLLRQPSALTNVPALMFTADAGRDFYAPRGILGIVGGTFVATDSGNIWVANGAASYNQVLGDGYPFERAVHFEYYFPAAYYPSNQAPARDDIGLRYSGSDYQRPRMTLQNAATDSPWNPWNQSEKPSLNIHFNGDYGSSPIKYPFFTNYPVSEFKHLRLRAGKNDNVNPFITDELVRRLYLDMGQVGSRGLFCSFYVNAIYKGIFNLAERIREPFFQEHYNSTESWDVDYSWSWVDGDGNAMWQLVTLLGGNITGAAAWQSVTNQIDVDNAADYYLLNIYCAMWDWPGNNFVIARERSTGPDSKFRFVVWDAEGGFNVNSYYDKTVAYNTISNDLVVGAANWNYIPYLFERLSTSPEFKLCFADHVNLRMFNGGVLDDRDPDGSGPLKSRFAQRLGELVTEVGPLVQYNIGSSLTTSAFDLWTNANNGRRSYLLGTGTGRKMLRDAGYWPLTEPPVFSQYGGSIQPNYPLSITSYVATAGQTATIYYTTNGADPRLFGGTLNPSAFTYTNAFPLNQMVTVKARARNNTTAEWSPLTQATFLLSVQPASTNNLVIAEMMYHPPDVSAAEAAAGFSNADDFEFIRLLNISTNSVDLYGAQFTVGITFAFSTGSIRYVAPGANVLIVKSRPAFQARYGHTYDAMIAGEYSGNLSNSGEEVRLMAPDGSILRDFTFDDDVPWPPEADGNGPSLILRNPWSNPNPAPGTNWMASAIPGGLPGGSAPAQSYSTWRALFWDSPTDVTNNLVSGPYADPDADGINNLFEYIYGLNPQVSQSAPQLLPTIETVNADKHLVVAMLVSGGAGDVMITPQISSDLLNWSNGAPAVQLLQAIPGEDGRVTYKYYDASTVSANQQRFIRFQYSVTLH
jgi:hypothetical protein